MIWASLRTGRRKRSGLPAAIGVNTHTDAPNLISAVCLDGLNSGRRIGGCPIERCLCIRGHDGVVVVNRLLHLLHLRLLLHDLELVNLDLLRRHCIAIASILVLGICAHNSSGRNVSHANTTSIARHVILAVQKVGCWCCCRASRQEEADCRDSRNSHALLLSGSMRGFLCLGSEAVRDAPLAREGWGFF